MNKYFSFLPSFPRKRESRKIKFKKLDSHFRGNDSTSIKNGKFFRNFYILTISSILFSACSFQPVALPQENTYALTAASQQQFATKPTAITLLINTPIANSAYHNAKMAYAMQPYQIRYFSYNRWVASPTDMLQSVMAESFRNSNYFHAVVAAPFSGSTNIRLDTQLLDFTQYFHGNSSEFHMALQMTLTDNTTDQILLSRSFQATVKAPSNNPQGGVIAANQATQQILNQAVSAVVSYLK